MKYDREKIAEMRENGLTYQQIADALETTKGNISSQITMMQRVGWAVTKQPRWSVKDDNYLIECRNSGIGYEFIAEDLGRTYIATKSRGSALIKKGLLEWTPHSERPTYTGGNPGSKVETYAEQDLLGYVKQYVSSDSCPGSIRYQVKKHFGSWTDALKAAGISGNIGGVMDPSKDTTLYLLDFGRFKKFGITQRSIKQRFSGAPAYIILDILTTSLDNAYYFEQEIKQAVASRAFQPKEPYFERRGKTECFIGPETQFLEIL